MTGKERIDAALEHREADRIPIQDNPWNTTVRRWREEGLPEDVSPHEYFGYELMNVGADTSFRFPVEKVDETDEYVLERNANGALRRQWKDKTGTPECVDFLIKSRKEWDEHKHRLEMSPERIDVEKVKKVREGADKAGNWLAYSGVVGYDKTQGIVGSANLLMAIIDDPDWVAEMFMKSVDLVIETADALIEAGAGFDGAFLFDDLGYRNAALFSPKAYRELLYPAHKKVFEYFHSKGLKVILHTCGCVKELVPQLIEAGLDCIQPLEVKAGMDLVEMKQKYGDELAFMGGIDVRCMAHPDPSVIEKEISTKIPIAKKSGGYIYHSDHSVPDNVSFAQYKRVIELVHKYGKY